MINDIEKILLSEEDLKSIVERLGKEISNDYKDKNLVLVSVLKGSVVFMADLMRAITVPCVIDFMSVSRINSPSNRFYAGQNIYACVKSVDDAGRIVLTHKELLGTWLENARLFKPQSVTTGIVRSIEDYGVFIELMPNLAGLAESCDGIKNGDVVNVYIKSILPDKMKVKLVIISKAETSMPSKNIKYFISDGHIDFWRYSTDSGIKNIYTDFT